ncbi:hypothetical protein E3N88_41366 [Mikania micrantha]|uniref:Uncharacterized protein n=1 Tax=Mikania micrantha TaxID=192012 RepID=A0A5N6LQD0_9ASTR|nr:hypothetical protein E3N88_41366 [Mikania micrantha]
MRCLDCGNKAKRDCLYYRCRSCCKGHGFQCQTHVKSTWVPISTRQMVMRDSVAAMVAPQQHHRQQEQLHLSSEPSSSSGFGGHFPAEVRGEATFTCVRVTTTSKANAHVDQYAYETTINIGGHVFRGILYDQGPHNTPMVNSSYWTVHEGDQHNSTINVNVPYNLQLANNLRSCARPSYPFNT